jgi:pectate lyase
MSIRERWRGWLGATATTVLVAGTVAIGAGAGAPAAQAATVDPNAWYELVSRHSGKAVEVAGQSTADGAMIQQWARTGGTHQQFRFVDSGGGFYRIMARHSGKVLDVFAWNPDDGAEIRQWPDLNGFNQQFQLLDSPDGYLRFVNRFSGKALDVWEWSTADGARISQFTDHGGANQQFQLVVVGGGPPPPPPAGGLVGWATVNGTTTGGAGGPTVTVTSGAQLVSEMQAAGPRTIQVSGTVSISGMNDVGPDKTIIGLGSNATITGGGLDIDEVSNVIIRNLNFRDWGDDAINVQDASHHVWIDHNTLSSGSDGAIDIKRESDFVTVSWNRIFDHDKSMLLGHSDGHTADTGHLRVTYHHNWFDGSNQRHPRVRYGNVVHVFNNFYDGVTGYGVASTVQAGVLVEGNYFENTDDPYHCGEGSSPPGNLRAVNNHFVGSGSGQTCGSVGNVPYSYNLDTPSAVKSIVTSGAGAGRI